MIHFKKKLVQQAYNLIGESRHMAACIDLGMIEQMKLEVKDGKFFSAENLNKYLRERYPLIDTLLNRASNMIPSNEGLDTKQSGTPAEYLLSQLEQDTYGIMCDVLLKSNVINQFDDFIDYVEP